MKTKKHLLKPIEKGKIAILITDDKIELSLSLIVPVHQKATKVPVSIIGDNKSQIPCVQTEVAVV